MRILITGISGFVGRRLAHALVARGDRVCGTYLGELPRQKDFLPQECILEEIDLQDEAALHRLVQQREPEAVVHLAGLSHVGASWKRPGEYFQVNVLGTENLLEAAAGKRVLVASSAEVYGKVPDDQQPIAEDRLLAPGSPYALTKAAAERLALGKGAIVVRSFNAIGPGQTPTFALPAFAAQLAAVAEGSQEPVLKVGNLEARRDFVHVDDVADGYVTLIDQGRPSTVYNLATGSTTSIGEALEGLIAVSKQKVRVETDPDRLRPVDVPLLCGSAARLQALGWSPRRSFQAALEELWAEASSPMSLVGP